MSRLVSRYQAKDRDRVLTLRNNGFSIREISDMTGINKSSIGRMVFPYNDNDSNKTASSNIIVDTSLSTLVDKFKGLSWLDFWQVLGPPVNKLGQETDCWPYELGVINDIETYRRIAINKAKAIGITELFLRYILYLCLARQLKGNYIIVCGNTWDIARGLMRRMKAMLLPHGITTDDRETVLTLPGCRIQAYSSEVNSFRGLTDVRFILADEVDFLEHSQDIRAVLDTYSVKSDAQIVLCSTPGQIDSTMYKLFKEPEPCLYHRITLPHQVAVGLLFTQAEIDHLQLTSPSFKREFCCVWGYVHEGSSFTDAQINRATSINYSLDIMPNGDITSSLGCDPGYTSGSGGGGAFGITITRYIDGLITVIYSQTFKEAAHNDMVDKVVELMDQYNVDKVWVDASAVSFIRSLKEAIDESVDYQRILEDCKNKKIDPFVSYMNICPINFGTKHKQLMSHAKALMSNGNIAIDAEKFPNLISALQTAKDRDDAYIKSEGLHTDEFDSFRLSINPEQYEFGGK